MKRSPHQAPLVSRPPAGGTATPWLVGAITATFLAAPVLAGPPGYKLLNKEEGGLIPHPVITSMSATQNLTVNWSGFKGPYNVEVSTDLNGGWHLLASNLNVLTLTVPKEGSMNLVRVQGANPPVYVGSEKCGLCHEDAHADWAQTAHASALATLKRIGQGTNASCLKCHTVGYGLPSGFVDETKTPGLAGVQCENCHGPGGDHIKKPTLATIQPVVTLSAKLCGGCHSDAHHPTFEEWETSQHAEVTPDVAGNFFTTNAIARMQTCGACHSGASRLAMEEAVETSQELGMPVDPEFPSGAEAAETGVTCAVCHEPHAKTAHGSQLRYPTSSKVPYTYNTGTNFAAQYNPNVMVCAQCHNSRNALWTTTSRPPHHSPQYNIMLGTGGWETATDHALVPQGAHMDVDTQCIHCHTHPHSPPAVTESSPNYMGHDFSPKAQSCLPCHDEIGAEILVEAVQADTKKEIAEVKGMLDNWATTKAPAGLQKYGILAWEYNNIGGLSTPTSTIKTGPTASGTTAEQNLIPENIKKARFNLYLVQHDGSFGVHNGNYARYLLKVARELIKAEVSKP